MSAVLLRCCKSFPTVSSFTLLLYKLFYVVPATIQLQPHVKLVWTSTSVHGPGIGVSVPCVCYDTVHVRVTRCVRVCVYVFFNPTLKVLFCFVAVLAAGGAVWCGLYPTVPPALKLSTLWQTRYNSSRTARLCEPLLTRLVLT